jgi:hypothetical protein
MIIHFLEGTNYIFLFLMKWEGTMAPAGPLLVPSLTTSTNDHNS